MWTSQLRMAIPINRHLCITTTTSNRTTTRERCERWARSFKTTTRTNCSLRSASERDFLLTVAFPTSSSWYFPFFTNKTHSTEDVAYTNCSLQNGHPSNPYCQGVEGILEAYTRTLRSVQLYGPTNFAPCINHVAKCVYMCMIS